jgi:hypothetical protein
MLKRTLTLFTLLFLIALPTVFAQSDTLHELEGGYVIETPTDWNVFLADDELRYFLTNADETILMSLLTPDQVNAVINPGGSRKSTRRTSEDVMVTILAEIDGIDLNKRDIEDIEYGGREGVGWYFSIDNDYDGLALVFELEGKGFLYADYYIESGELASATEVVEPIITSFKSADEAAASSGEPCFVSVDQADTARLRVGPGEHRSAVAFLKPNREFPVTGKLTDEDGNVWYQLDKAEVAPDSSAAELWVIADEIEETGGCDQVADASAPPIIPSTSGGGGASGSTGSGSTTTQPGTLPASGAWTLTMDATSYASCAGTQSISFNTTELFITTSFGVLVQVSADGSTITMDGDVLRLNNSPGNYLGSYDLGGGVNAQIYLTVNSASSMSGRLVANTTFNGVGCSVTVPFGMSR